MNDVILISGTLLAVYLRKVAFSMSVYYIAHFFEHRVTGLFGHSERKEAIHTHFLERALGNGHQSKKVTDCHEQSCSLLSATA